jgi:DNA-binding NarL/FixJ family response regulator
MSDYKSDITDNSKAIKVMLVDDHSLMRDSLRMHLDSQADMKVIGEASNGEEAVKLATELTPDIIIMDIAMPRMSGLEATRQIKAINRNIIILVLTVHDDIEYILKILESGADGYLTKNLTGEELIDAVRLVLSGESVLSSEVMSKLLKHALRYPTKPSAVVKEGNLSVRELEILRLVAKGVSNKQIAQELNISLRTVKGHVFNIFSKLNANSRTEAVIKGLREGLISYNEIGLNN